VLDPFAGSGTTCAAALKTGRHFIGIEIEEEYVSIAKKKIKETLAVVNYTKKCNKTQLNATSHEIMQQNTASNLLTYEIIPNCFS